MRSRRGSSDIPASDSAAANAGIPTVSPSDGSAVSQPHARPDETSVRYHCDKQRGLAIPRGASTTVQTGGSASSSRFNKRGRSIRLAGSVGVSAEFEQFPQRLPGYRCRSSCVDHHSLSAGRHEAFDTIRGDLESPDRRRSARQRTVTMPVMCRNAGWPTSGPRRNPPALGPTEDTKRDLVAGREQVVDDSAVRLQTLRAVAPVHASSNTMPAVGCQITTRQHFANNAFRRAVFRLRCRVPRRERR